MTTTAPWTTEKPTALLVLADGTVIEGRGLVMTPRPRPSMTMTAKSTDRAGDLSLVQGAVVGHGFRERSRYGKERGRQVVPQRKDLR